MLAGPCRRFLGTRRFTREHEWILTTDTAATPETAAKVGLTPYAVQKLGDVVYVELPARRAELAQNAPLGNVESVKAAVEVYAPVSGIVLDVNTDLEQKPQQLNKAPLEAWLCTLKIKNPHELSSLMNEEEYNAYIGEKP